MSLCAPVALSGIDSRYNEGCSELASYLFFGLYQHNQKQLCEDFPEEVLDGMILHASSNSTVSLRNANVLCLCLLS